MTQEDDLYKDLGVEKGASKSDIKKAWREKARKLHPDKSGTKDTEKEFIVAQRAYLILIDDEARKRYDEHGDTRQANQALDQAEQFLMGIFSRLIDNFMQTGRRSNFVADAKNMMKEQSYSLAGEIKSGERLVKKYDEISGEIESEGEYNLYQMVLDQKMTAFKTGLERKKQEKAMVDQAIEILIQYRDGYVKPDSKDGAGYIGFEATSNTNPFT